MDPATIAILVALGVPFLCSVATAILPSGSPWMKVVDALALAVGKAKPDPTVQ